jgi:hypothetical protein
VSKPGAKLAVRPLRRAHILSSFCQAHLPVSAHGCGRQTVHCFFARTPVAGGEISTHALDLAPSLLRTEFRDSGLGNRITFLVLVIQLARAQLHHVQLRKVVHPVGAERPQPTEDHRVDRRQISASANPDAPQVKAHVVTFPPLVPEITQVLVQERRRATERSEIDEPSVRGDHFVVVGEDVPQAGTH